MKKTTILTGTVLISFAMMLAIPSCGSDVVENVDYTIWKEEDRLINFFIKLKSGADLTLGTLGGSITEQDQWSSVVAKWLDDEAKKYGGSVTQLNRGVSDTDSGFGLYRVQDQLLRVNPDMIIFESSVNDAFYFDTYLYCRTVEGLARMILKDSERVAIPLLVNTAQQGNDGYNPTHYWYKEIGRKYNLPTFCWMDYGEPPDNNWNRFYWGDPSSMNNGDFTHPNEAGGQSIAKGITDYFQSVMDNLPSSPVEIDTRLPSARFFNDFEKVKIYHAGNATPTLSSGDWEKANIRNQSAGQAIKWNEWSSELSKAEQWRTNNRDAEFSIDFKGKSVMLVSWAAGDNNDAATAIIKDKDGKIVQQREFSSRGQGGSSMEVYCYYSQLIADRLDPDAEYTLVIKNTWENSQYGAGTYYALNIVAVVVSDTN